MFMLSLQAAANYVSGVIDNTIIEELVTYNFDIKEGQTYPKITYDKHQVRG